MRVLWLVRPDLDREPGGDTTQIHQTATALRRLGVSPTLSSAARPDLDGFDLVHLFHLDRVWENARWCRLIRARGLPAVLSPLYWPTEEFDRHGRSGVQGWLAQSVGPRAYPSLRIAQRSALSALSQRDLRALRLSFRRSVRFVLDTIDALLPNSQAEKHQIRARFGASCPITVVPNAVDASAFGGPPDWKAQRDEVLCVGRLEPRKNQLALIRAVRGMRVRLRLVGQAGHFNRPYERRCRREAGSEVEFLGHRTPAELRWLYRCSRVHASASWYETPGLASLEAAACGCSVVVGEGGCTREYFGDQAQYCRPGDVRSIRTAIEKAFVSSPGPALAERVVREFNWEAAARRTLACYRQAAARERRPPDHRELQRH